MLLHRAITERILASEGSIKPVDESTVEMFSNLVEKRMASLAKKVIGEGIGSSGSPGVSEEALLKDLGYINEAHPGIGRITTERVHSALG